jgi:hypothetical protein
LQGNSEKSAKSNLETMEEDVEENAEKKPKKKSVDGKKSPTARSPRVSSARSKPESEFVFPIVEISEFYIGSTHHDQKERVFTFVHARKGEEQKTITVLSDKSGKQNHGENRVKKIMFVLTGVFSSCDFESH